MSYIAFDLDALNRVPHAAAAAGLPPERVSHGLLQLWAWCFREETASVTVTHIRGFFGADATEALSAFGFLEAGQAAWRVKGAERYLRVKAGQRKGGKNASKNLIPGGPKAKKSTKTPQNDVSRGGEPRGEPRPSRDPAEGGAEGEPRLDLGLSPSTEHRAPNALTTFPAHENAPAKKAKAPKPEKPPPDPRHQPLVKALTDTFEAKRGAKYPFDHGREAVEVTRLLESGMEPPAIVAAWERALDAQYPPCATLAKFRMRLPDFVGTGPPRKGEQPSFVGTGPLRAEIGTL